MSWLARLLAFLLGQRFPVPTPTPVPTPAPSPTGNAIIDEINRRRALQGCRPFRFSLCLSKQSEAWAKVMEARGYEDHDRMRERLSACGIGAGGECVAQGDRTAEEAVNAWWHSAGHYAILTDTYEFCGAGSSGVFWCAEAGDSNLFVVPPLLTRGN